MSSQIKTPERSASHDCSLADEDNPIGIGVFERTVILNFAAPVEWIVLCKSEALALSNLIRLMAERLPG